ncbi:MAG TPA: hypothetical protein VIJ12_09415 [Candidatus Baltobacteraceae bacterium]
MPRRIELARHERLQQPLLTALTPTPLAAVLPDADLEIPPLPRDLPPWVKDAIALSQRARDLIGRLAPIVIAVLTFWDHRVRSASIGGKHIAIDPSGSYRLDAG